MVTERSLSINFNKKKSYLCMGRQNEKYKSDFITC